MSVIQKVQSFFTQQHINAKEGVVLACSTGIDSMALLHILQRLDAKIVVAHVNHGVRKDSKKEEAFLKTYCENHELELEILHLNPKIEMPRGENFQHWARLKRYHFFSEVAANQQCKYIATAHHATDKTETFFMNALRGSGVTGLTGLREKKGHIIRPLLQVEKAEIIAFADEEKLNWNEDSSNATDAYLRNRVRNKILPQLDEVDSKWQSGLKVTLQNLEDERSLIKTMIKDWEDRNIRHESNRLHISIEALEKHPAATSLLRHLLFDIDPALPFYAMAHAKNDETGSYYIGSSHRALKDREWLIVEPVPKVTDQHLEWHIYAENTALHEPFSLTMEQFAKPQSFSFNSMNLDKSSALLDFDALSFPLTLRKWKPGDRFRPLGMKGFKKISDFLIDEKVARNEKENTFVLTSNEEVIWVIGHRIDDRFKVGKDTQIMYLARLHNP